ncbi:MAG: hypothetical protein WC302_00880 [Candidatus Paceibacterota bacterium]|jgi:hypothetical protein
MPFDAYDYYGLTIEAIASCALEGNSEAIRILKLQKTDHDQFLIEVKKIMKRTKGE